MLLLGASEYSMIVCDNQLAAQQAVCSFEISCNATAAIRSDGRVLFNFVECPTITLFVRILLYTLVCLFIGAFICLVSSCVFVTPNRSHLMWTTIVVLLSALCVIYFTLDLVYLSFYCMSVWLSLTIYVMLLQPSAAEEALNRNNFDHALIIAVVNRSLARGLTPEARATFVRDALCHIYGTTVSTTSTRFSRLTKAVQKCNLILDYPTLVNQVPSFGLENLEYHILLASAFAANLQVPEVKGQNKRKFKARHNAYTTVTGGLTTETTYAKALLTAFDNGEVEEWYVEQWMDQHDFDFDDVLYRHEHDLSFDRDDDDSSHDNSEEEFEEVHYKSLKINVLPPSENISAWKSETGLNWADEEEYDSYQSEANFTTNHLCLETLAAKAPTEIELTWPNRVSKPKLLKSMRFAATRHVFTLEDARMLAAILLGKSSWSVKAGKGCSLLRSVLGLPRLNVNHAIVDESRPPSLAQTVKALTLRVAKLETALKEARVQSVSIPPMPRIEPITAEAKQSAAKVSPTLVKTIKTNTHQKKTPKAAQKKFTPAFKWRDLAYSYQKQKFPQGLTLTAFTAHVKAISPEITSANLNVEFLRYLSHATGTHLEEASMNGTIVTNVKNDHKFIVPILYNGTITAKSDITPDTPYVHLTFVSPGRFVTTAHFFIRSELSLGFTMYYNNRFVPFDPSTCTFHTHLDIYDDLVAVTLPAKYPINPKSHTLTPTNITPTLDTQVSVTHCARGPWKNSVSNLVLSPCGYYTHRCDSTFGTCGAALVNPQNHVVGIHRGTDNSTNIASALSTEYLAEFTEFPFGDFQN
jgi:hypothetical protein